MLMRLVDKAKVCVPLLSRRQQKIKVLADLIIDKVLINSVAVLILIPRRVSLAMSVAGSRMIVNKGLTSVLAQMKCAVV